MDHVKHFVFSKGHVLAENLSTNFFQILDWPRNVHNAQKINFFNNSAILSFRVTVFQYLLLCRLREQLAVFWVEQDSLPKALEGLKMHFLLLLGFDLKRKTINGFSFSKGVCDDTIAGQMSPILQQSKYEKKQLTRFQTVPSTVTSHLTRRKNSLSVKTQLTELRFRIFLSAVAWLWIHLVPQFPCW